MKNNKSKEILKKNTTNFKSNIEQYQDNLKKIKDHTKKSFNIENNKEYQETKLDKRINGSLQKIDDEYNKFWEKNEKKLDVFFESCGEKIADFYEKIPSYFVNFGIFLKKATMQVKLFCKKGNGFGGFLLLYLLIGIFLGIMALIYS